MVKGNNLHKSLSACLKELRMPTVRECYRDEAESARRGNRSGGFTLIFRVYPQILRSLKAFLWFYDEKMLGKRQKRLVSRMII